MPVPLEPAKELGTGTVRDPEMAALDEVIEKIDDPFFPVITRIQVCATSSPTSATGWRRARLCSSRLRNNSLAQFSASPDLHTEFLGGDRGDGLLGGPLGADSQLCRAVAETPW